MSETIVPGRLRSLVEQVLEFGGSIDPMVIEVSEKPQGSCSPAILIGSGGYCLE